MTHIANFRLFVVACLLAIACGCSGDRSVAGGTKGTLRHGTTDLRDVQVSVYAAGSREPIGFGITTEGGRFELYQSNAQGALHLPPGDYAFTLESVGPDPILFTPEIGDPLRTPIRKSWTAGEAALELVIP